MQKVKVKIKKLNESGGPKPLYQQDKMGGLNAYYLPMQSKKKEDGAQPINHSEEVVDRDEANVELEKGEVVFTPAKEESAVDGPQMTMVNGKTHEKGGSPAKLEDGAFVFSDHLKMPESDKKVLGGSGKNLTYAAFSKKYVKPFNESVRTLKTSKDKLDKETSGLNVKNIKDKLAKVSLLQEAEKGFPQGVPEMANEFFGQNAPEEQQTMMEEGGLFKMQPGGRFNLGRNVKKSEFDELLKKGYKQDPKNPKWASLLSTDGMGSKKYAPSKNKMESEKWYNTQIKPQLEAGVTPDDIIKNGGLDPSWRERALKDYKPKSKFDMVYYQDGTTTPSTTPSVTGAPISDIPKEKGLSPNDAGKTYTKPFKDTGYGWMEGVSMAAPFAQAINRYAPIKKRVEAQQLNFRPVDFEAQRQSIKGQVASAGKQNVLLSPTSSMSSVRNAQLLSSTLNPLNESFMNEFNTNQMGYQQTEAQNAQARQGADSFNTQMADKYDTGYAQLNENFDARKSQRFGKFLQNWQTAEKSRQQRNMLNTLMTDYEIGPNQEIIPIAQSKDQKMARIMNGQRVSSTGSTSDDYIRGVKEVMDKYSNLNLTWDQAEKAYKSNLPRSQSNSQLKMLAKQYGIELD